MVSDIYGERTGMSRDRLSTIILSGGKRLQNIDSGRDLNTATFERAMQWLSDNWPDGAVWPAEVPRPLNSPGVTIGEAAE